MKFKDFLLEMGQLLPHHSKAQNVISNKPVKNIEHHGKLHSTLENGFEVRHKNLGNGEHTYNVVDPKTKLVHLNLETSESKPNQHTIGVLSGRKDSQVKAHELYHHLISKHDHQFMTHSQTVGGFKVWQKLHKMPGVDIHVHDSNTKTTTKVDNMDNHSDFHHQVKNYKIDGNHPNLNKYLIAKKSSIKEEVNCAAFAGSGDSRLPVDQREPAVSKTNKYLKQNLKLPIIKRK